MWWDDPAAVKARLAELELREPRTKGVGVSVGTDP
jgi:hypothetical protein